MNKINFSIGPVMMYENTKSIGSEEVPYFRTQEFSNVVFKIDSDLKQILNFNSDSKVLLLTGSGTLGMETAVSSLFDENDKLLIVNGGTFGQRFVNLAKIYNYNYSEIRLASGEKLTEKRLLKELDEDVTAILVNHHETSTGVLYDLEMVKKIAKKHNKLLVVDAISSFIAEDINNNDDSIDCLILGSQKGLALPPGLSIIVLSKRAINKIKTVKQKSLYLDINYALDSATRGQTPFTPAVGIILQLQERLEKLVDGGIEHERNKIVELGTYFRKNITDLGLELFIANPSNALTPIYLKENAYKTFELLKDEFNIWVAPSGGELRDNLLRVGHLCNLKKEDYKKLIKALKEIKERGIL